MVKRGTSESEPDQQKMVPLYDDATSTVNLLPIRYCHPQSTLRQALYADLRGPCRLEYRPVKIFVFAVILIRFVDCGAKIGTIFDLTGLGSAGCLIPNAVLEVHTWSARWIVGIDGRAIRLVARARSGGLARRVETMGAFVCVVLVLRG